MDLKNVLAELRKERDAIDAAILSLERLDRLDIPEAVRGSGLSVSGPKNGVNGAYRNSGLGESS